MALLTVITVVKDDASGLENTLASLDAQVRSDTNLVVVDGSTDPVSVPTILDKHPATTATYSWSPPAGVYAAMNDGLSIADGAYVYFLNAGDILAANDVLEQVTTQLAATTPSWAYGRVKFLGSDGSSMPEPDWDYLDEYRHWFSRGRFPAHQGVVVAAEELRRQGGFDTSYKVAADYASILHCARQSQPLNLNLVLAEFTVGGLSTQQWRTAQAEFHRARLSAFDLSGVDRAREQAYTWRAIAATSAYRALWAPGRPAHGLVQRLRSR